MNHCGERKLVKENEPNYKLEWHMFIIKIKIKNIFPWKYIKYIMFVKKKMAVLHNLHPNRPMGY